MTASPMYRSTVPPCRSRTRRAASKLVAMASRRTSGRQHLVVEGRRPDVGEDDGHGLARLARAPITPGAGTGRAIPGVGRVGRRHDRDEVVRRQTGCHSLGHDVGNGFHLDVVGHKPPCALREQDPVCRRAGLHRRGDRHDRPGQDVLAGPRLADEQFTGRDPRPIGQANAPLTLQPVVEVGQDPLGFGRRPDGAQGVVVALLGQAEDRDDGVADDLLDDAAVRFEHDSHLVEVAGEDLAQRLRVEPLTQAGRALEVGRHDRHEAGGLDGRVGSGSPRTRRHCSESRVRRPATGRPGPWIR